MRRLVVLADGTWRSEDDPRDVTNVERLKNALPVTDPDGTVQQPYYIRGLGTRRFERLTGGAFGVGISRNVRDGYRWLARTYQPDCTEPIRGVGVDLRLSGWKRIGWRRA